MNSSHGKKPKFDVDNDPNGNHHRLLEAFYGYIRAYEQFCEHPSKEARIESRAHLKVLLDCSLAMRKDIVAVHELTREKRRIRDAERKRQRELKKIKNDNQGSQ